MMLNLYFTLQAIFRIFAHIGGIAFFLFWLWTAFTPAGARFLAWFKDTFL